MSGNYEFDIMPELKHCEDEVNAACINQDIEALKAIFIREGVEWVEFVPSGKYKPDTWY